MHFKLFFFLLPFSLFAEIGYIEPWGKDANFKIESHKPKSQLSPMGLFAEKAILFHHNFSTHISGPRSHYRPTSSRYMLQAIREFGFVTGYIMGCDRLLRENSDPWVYRSKRINEKLYKWDPPLRL